MNDKQRLDFIAKEVETITMEVEPLFQQLLLLNNFIKDISKVAKGEEPTYNLNEFVKKNK